MAINYSTMSIAHIRKTRGLPFLKVGMRIESLHAGRKGKITSARNGYLKIMLDGDKHSGAYHPWWMIRYFDKEGNMLWEGRD
jgi:hypothetical protein